MTSLVRSSRHVTARSHSNSWSGSSLLSSNVSVDGKTHPIHPTLPSSLYSQRRCMGSGGGARGARGHGWWVNYRQGKGGRHLQGEYSDRTLEELQAWNDAIFSLGSQLAYIDIRTEAVLVNAEANNSNSNSKSNSADDDTATTYRLKLELATAVLPRATENFLKLLQAPAGVGYTSTVLHRVEKKVGLMGGLVWNGHHQSEKKGEKTRTSNLKQVLVGKCHEDLRMPTSFTNMDVSSERMVLSHVPGILTMVSPRVHEIDSRFLLCSTYSPHLDGKAVAIGRLADEESFQTVQQWEQTLITHKGRPTNVVLRIAECGLLQAATQNHPNPTPESTEKSEAKHVSESL
ncbi:cyclophilin-type peptidyl-prolyl cis-trans isomerase [Nitzschia inconspicua]|uniref:Cyclophilin-type peptidyl-prolyl cis-trans isomerase n=1 Tax=Nitzschia inconspicua TaxID=303405 RepID=A0A9K3KBU5_9STRA|nr:cyclophilin-type peptidyl-prolyl cis-trans isomerase [Nitzschia inconspicua]